MDSGSAVEGVLTLHFHIIKNKHAIKINFGLLGVYLILRYYLKTTQKSAYPDEECESENSSRLQM